LQDRGPAAYVAELLGTLFLVFFITAVVSLYVVPSTPQQPTPFIDFSVIGLVQFLVLFVLVQTLAVVSGAHFNPAVTVAMTAVRQIKPPDALIYIVAQLAGGVGGALLTKALLLDEGRDVDYGAAVVSDRLEGDWFPGMLAEALGAFFLMWAIIGVAVNPRATKEWAALAIGGALGSAVMVSRRSPARRSTPPARSARPSCPASGRTSCSPTRSDPCWVPSLPRSSTTSCSSRRGRSARRASSRSAEPGPRTAERRPTHGPAPAGS